MNCQGNPQIRIAYILFLAFLMVLFSFFELIEKKSQNGYVIIFTIIEMAFIFLHSPVYRTGGDEFAVLLQGLDYENREELTKKLDMYGDERYAGYSFAWGMSEFNEEEDIDVHDVYQRADTKMYENKRKTKELQRRNS